MSPRREDVPCSECGTTNPLNSKFCESCGLRLVVDEPSVDVTEERPRARARSARAAAPRESKRREIERAVARARTKLKGIRVLFIVLAVLNGLFGLMAWAVAGTDPEIWVIVVACGLMVGLFSAAAVFLYDHPLFWVVTMASLYTVMTILAPGVISILICLGLWGAMPVMLNITRLQKEHPELITAENLRHRRRKGLSTEAEARLDDRRAARSSHPLRSYGIVVGIVVLGVVALVLASAMSGRSSPSHASSERPEARVATAGERALFQAAIGKFELLWGASDGDGLQDLGNDEFRQQRWPKVVRILAKRGWSETYPPIDFERTLIGPPSEWGEVWFSVTPRGTLKTHWVLEDGIWRVRRLVLSRTR